MDDLGITVQAAWLRLLAAAGYPVLAGRGGSFAVRTGIWSNTENGVVLTAEAFDDPAALDALLSHAREASPASAVLLSPPDPDDVAALIGRRWRPERGAQDMVGPLVIPGRDDPAGVEVREVLDEAGRVAHVDVFAGDGWFEAADRDAELALARRLGPGDGVRRWVALDGVGPVGAASSVLVKGTDVVSLDGLCVVHPHRRRGIGTALTRARLRAAAADGARRVHLSPSPDGAALHGALGLTARPTPPDRWFYSPTPADGLG